MIFERAYTLLRKIISSRVNSKTEFSDYYQYSIPWIFEEILIYLRNDDKEEILLKKQFRESLKQLIIHYILVFYNKVQLLFAKQSDIVFITSHPDHTAQYFELETELKEKDLTCVYLTNKLKIYKELIKKKRRVYFLDNANKNNLNSFYFDQPDILAFENAIDIHINKHKRYFKYLENQIDFLISRLSPKVLITANELLVPHRVAVIAFKNKKLLTLCLQHGSITSSYLLYKEMLVDHFLVYGKISKEILVKMGFPIEKIVIVGSLLYKNNITHYEPSTQKFLNTNKKNVFIALSGPGNSTSLKHHLNQIHLINILAQKFTNLHFFIKLHPKDDIRYYSSLIGDNINVVSHTNFVNQQGSFHDVITRSNLMVTSVSASMYDAFKLGIPVCVIDLENEYIHSDVVQYNLVDYCTDYDAIHNVLNNLSNDSTTNNLKIANAKNYITDFYNLNVNETPSNSIVNLIKEFT